MRNADKIYKSPKCFKVQAQGNNPNIFEIKYIYLGFNAERFVQLNIRADDPNSIFFKKPMTLTKQYNAHGNVTFMSVQEDPLMKLRRKFI